MGQGGEGTQQNRQRNILRVNLIFLPRRNIQSIEEIEFNGYGLAKCCPLLSSNMAAYRGPKHVITNS